MSDWFGKLPKDDPIEDGAELAEAPVNDWFGELPKDDPIWDAALAEARALVGDSSTLIQFAFELYAGKLYREQST